MTANMAQGWSHGPVGAAVAAWPAVSLVGSYELLVWLIRRPGRSNEGHHQRLTAPAPAAGFSCTHCPPLRPTTGSPAGASMRNQTGRGGRQVTQPRIRPPPQARRMTMRWLGQIPSTAGRWLLTGGACEQAIRSPSASSPRCSGRPRVAGRVPGSPRYGGKRRWRPPVTRYDSHLQDDQVTEDFKADSRSALSRQAAQ